jgi:hypothetical protein
MNDQMLLVININLYISGNIQCFSCQNPKPGFGTIQLLNRGKEAGKII